jgi:RNA-binding protein YlmH
VIAVEPVSAKFAENLSHRDYLGAILSLGIERSLIGDILVREKQAWFFCLDSAADFLTSSLTRIRNTAVSASLSSAEAPELRPRYEQLRLNVASERLDAVLSAFTGLSRARTADLFSGEKVFVNGRIVTDKSARLKEGDLLSVRGFGKAAYQGIEVETRKNRLWVSLLKYV